MTWLTVLAVIGVALIITLERDRLREVARVALLVVTGGVLIAPLRDVLERGVARMRVFLAGQLAHGEPAEAAAGIAATAATVAAADRAEADARAANNQAPRASHGRYHVTRIIIAFVLTGILAAVIAFEWTFGLYTLPGLLGTPVDGGLPKGLTWIATIALLACAILWGLILLEAVGYTHFMPEFNERAKPVFRTLAIVALSLVLTVAVTMGVWRARQVAQPVDVAPASSLQADDAGGAVIETDGNAGSLSSPAGDLPADGLDTTARVVVGGVLPALVMVSGAVAFTGLIWLAKYVAVALLGTVLMALGLLLLVIRIFDNLVAHLILAVQHLIDWIAALGQRVVDTIWPPIESLRDAVHRKIAAWARRWSPGGPEPVLNEPAGVGAPAAAGVSGAGAPESTRAPNAPNGLEAAATSPFATPGQPDASDDQAGFALFDDLNWGPMNEPR
jgi:hypothetical protein